MFTVLRYNKRTEKKTPFDRGKKMERDNQNPAFIRCRAEHFDAVTAMYERAVAELERTVNYPKWKKDHPGRDYVKEAIAKGEQFACVAEGEILGAVVLNEDPEGNYAIGRWSRDLPDGAYLVVHILAVDPAWKGRGIGGFLVDGAIAYAKEQGYRAIRLDIVPDNLPAKRLYTSRGFVSAGQMNVRPELTEIPIFELYELNLR